MLVLPESAGRVCCANNLLGGLTYRWPTKLPSSWGQSWAFWGLDPCFVSLRLCLLGLCPPEFSVVGKMAARPKARAKNLLAGLAPRWPLEQPRAWVQANARQAQTPAGVCVPQSVRSLEPGIKMEVSLS